MKTDDVCLQESPEQKAKWLEEAKVRLPLGCRVRVVRSDVPAYVGAVGEVVDYDIGVFGEWPMVSVKFDAPIDGTVRDGFYADMAFDDEIVHV